MSKKISTHSLGKLKIYITAADIVTKEKRTAWQKFFPKSAYRHIVEDAKKEGIVNATVYNTHFGFSNREKIQSYSMEGGNSRLTLCVELVDKRERLESFFIKHKEHLKGKVVIYKEVEFWDIE